MPRIVRAEFLSYDNPARNSDKVFNVFLIEETDGIFSCVAEYGRRGNRLVRKTLCASQSREAAESKLRQKLIAKRNHRETPYSDDASGFNYSQIAGEYDFSLSSSELDATRTNQSPAEPQNSVRQKAKIIEFPTGKKEVCRQKPEQTGILNKSQFDSLEI